MHDIIQDVEKWLNRRLPVAMATVIETWGSAPRSVGAKMAFTASGELSGSVSGGCVEGSVIEAGYEVIESGRPQLLKYGVSDDSAWDVGLACGGTIEVFVERMNPVLQKRIHVLSNADESFAVTTVINGPVDWIGVKVIVNSEGRIFGEFDDSIEGTLSEIARSAISSGKSQRHRLDVDAEDEHPIEFFVEVINPAPTLVLVGGVHIAITLTRIAKELGYRIVVIDPRKAFGTQERFAEADRLIQAWPKEAFKKIEVTNSTAVAILTHDPKIDDPALIHFLSTPAFYIGALGSRKTHASRIKRLGEAGLTAAHIERIHAPIGVDIGATSPEEIAVSIMAEIVAARHYP